jgi:hypothetical protein
VEIGWYESPQGAYTCLDTTTGAVKEEAFASNSGMNNCLHGPGSIPDGVVDTFSVKDTAQNGIWSYGHGGSTIWTSPSLGSFNSGMVINNGERLNTGNTAHADFNGLQRMDSSNNFVNWASTSLLGGGFSDDSGSHGCKYSDIHTAVKLNGTAC